MGKCSVCKFRVFTQNGCHGLFVCSNTTCYHVGENTDNVEEYLTKNNVMCQGFKKKEEDKKESDKRCKECFYSREEKEEKSNKLICCCMNSPCMFKTVSEDNVCCYWESESNFKDIMKIVQQKCGCELKENCEESSRVKKVNPDNNVDHPERYNKFTNECIDEMITVFGIDAVIDFCQCNVWKYRYRNTCEEDLKKADWYMNKLMELKKNTW